MRGPPAAVRLRECPGQAAGITVEFPPMTDRKEISQITERIKRDPGRYFVVGGVVPIERSGYLHRDADEQLYRIAVASEYAHVFAPRQSGKSSLTARVAERLRARDRQVAVVDISQIGAREGTIDSARWFYSFAFRLIRQLRIRVDLQSWWQDKAKLTNRQRLTEFYWDIILGNTQSAVTVFVDSPQPFDVLPFADDLLASINSAHTARAAEPEFSRLNFVLLAVGEPAQSRDSNELSFFAASERVELLPFSEAQIMPLEPGLGFDQAEGLRALKRVYFWTSGQPFLTMKLARSLSRQSNSEKDVTQLVDDCVRQLFGHSGVFHSEPHLNGLQRALLFELPDRNRTLTLFGKVRKGERVFYNPESLIQQRLLNEGLLRVASDESLVISNRIYAMAFTTGWVNEHLTINLRASAGLAAAVVLTLVIPLWYSQVLPARWIDRIQNPVDIADATDAHERMRAWPGHRKNANHLLADVLASRSQSSDDLSAVGENDRLLRELPGTRDRADELLARFWDRQATTFEALAERDKALASRLNSLKRPTDYRLQRALGLIGDDYQHLLAAVRFPDGVDQAALTRDAMTLVAVSGNRVSRRSLASNSATELAAFDASALEIFPVISRISVVKAGRAGRFSLRVRVKHDRPTDLDLRLTAPSGRSVLLTGAEANARENDELVFESVNDMPLAALVTEAAEGSWSLSVADRVPAISGVLVDWQLRVSGNQAFRSVEENLLLREPIVDQDAFATLSPHARYVVAVPKRARGVAQVWDVAGAQAVSSIPVQAADRILGFVLDERIVLVATSDGIRAFALATGESSWAPPAKSQLRRSSLSLNGQFLVAASGGEDPGVDLYDLIEERHLGRLAAGIDNDAIAVANDGRHVAVADADRTVRLWRLGTASPVAEFASSALISALDFDAEHQQLAVRTVDNRLTLWRLADENRRAVMFSADDDWQIRFDGSGLGVFAGNASEGFQLFDTSMQRELSPLLRADAHGGSYQLQLRADRNTVLMFSPEEGVAKVFRLPVASPSRATETLRTARAAISPDGRWIASEMERGELSILPTSADPTNFQSKADAVRFLGHSAAISRLRFSERGNLLASAAMDGSVRIWDSASAQPRNVFIRLSISEVGDMAFSKDESLLAVASGNSVEVFDAENGDLLSRHYGDSSASSVMFSDDGSFVYSGFADGTLARMASNDGSQADQISLGEGAISALARSGDVLLVATETAALFRLNAWRDESPARIASGGEVCRELQADITGEIVVCRGASWLRSVAIAGSEVRPDQVRARMLPASFVFSGLAVSTETVSVVAALPEPRAVVLNMTAPAEVPAEFQIEEFRRSWEARLGFAPDWFRNLQGPDTAGD